MDLTGMLTKRGNKLKTWRRRYFELHYNNLCYYVYNGGPRKGEYIIDAKTTVLENNLRKHGFCLVQQNGRTLYMSADNESDKEMWMNALREIIIALQAEPASSRSKRISLSEEAWTSTSEDTKRIPLTSEIHIRIIEARDLAAKGSTNTYAKIFVDSISLQTKVSKKDLNPVWNEIFHFPCGPNLRFAKVEVWDNDPMLSARDNFLGVVYIPIWCLPQNKAVPKWYKLGKRTSKSHVSGEIKILAYSDITPDLNALRILHLIQNIPELNCGSEANLRYSSSGTSFFEGHSSPLQEEFLGRFPSRFPPLETEILEDLSLLVSMRLPDKPTDSQAIYADGMLMLTNYRLIFVSHRRLAISSELSDPVNYLVKSHHESCELSFHIPLASIVSISMSLQPDPSATGGPFGPFLDALSIKTNDARSFCLIFHNTETTSHQDSSFSATNRDSSAYLPPGTPIQFPKKQVKVPTRRASAVPNRLFRSPFQRRRSQSVDNSLTEATPRVLPSGRIRRRSIAKSSLGDELSYLEATDSSDGPPCQRILTRISNKVINRIAEIYTYENLHANLLSVILKSSTAVNQNQSISSLVPQANYTRWLFELSTQDRNIISRVLLDGWNIYDPVIEFKRMGIPDAAWRISNVNADYEVCPTYPAVLAVPTCLDDHRIVLAAQFRSRQRLPAFSWRHPLNHCCLCRASQPLVGLSQNRSIDDEVLLEAINLSSKVKSSERNDDNQDSLPSVHNTSPLIIIDARPKINAQANQAAGKGYETGKGYENCRVLFMGIANIHVMRKSIDMLEDLCTASTSEDANWLKNLEATGWLLHVSRVLTAAVRIVHCISFEEYSVLVHCSDGWDRTAQLTSLAMLMMDPFYRTYCGFMILVEKEWFSFGHKFADRLGWTEGGWIDGERSPVFHQFLDCVHQCVYQNPAIFEFNQEMLVFLGQHVLSGWFGNVFANSELDRSGLWESTVSIWTFLDINKQHFTNPYFSPLEAPYWIPNTSVRCQQVWEFWFLRWSNAIWDFSWKKRNEDFSENPEDPSVWMEDNMAQSCCNCQKYFNLIRRRHHCRACGRIFCENCVRQTRIIPNISDKIPVRCCDDCSNQMALVGEDKPISKENHSPSKNSSIASFFGIKSKPNDNIVIENESYSDSPQSQNIPEPAFYAEAESSERDTETIFDQLVDESDSVTMYPDQKHIDSVKILPTAALPDRPHNISHDPKSIDHLVPLAVNHRPFESFDYSESGSEVDEVERTHTNE